MNRDFSRLNIYLNRLLEDVYEQPEDSGHTKMAMEVYNKWFKPNRSVKTLLDVGCGDTAFMKPLFEILNIVYTGIAIKTENPNIKNMDFTFLDFEDSSFDCIFSRHSLEHSPMPLISLMEWNRVSRAWLCLILPNPLEFGWAGKNHYSMLHPTQVEFLLQRANWHIIWTDFSNPKELRYMCEKITKTEYEKGINNEV